MVMKHRKRNAKWLYRAERSMVALRAIHRKPLEAP